MTAIKCRADPQRLEIQQGNIHSLNVKLQESGGKKRTKLRKAVRGISSNFFCLSTKSNSCKHVYLTNYCLSSA